MFIMCTGQNGHFCLSLFFFRTSRSHDALFESVQSFFIYTEAAKVKFEKQNFSKLL